MVERQNMHPIRKIINIVLMTIIIFVLFCSLVVIIGDGIKTLAHGITIQNHVIGNNLSLPFPNTDYSKNIVLGKSQRMAEYDMYINLSIEEFAQAVEDNYYYSEDYNCKYWSFVWTLYWQAHEEEYNWKLEYIDTPTHVFVMVYNESGYCIMDQMDVLCRFENDS